ncbi:Calx-beta domain-containing protein [Haliea sp.]|jgi:hypothetical protein|uniref:Calx-beta domain-containing protein n=1 Tax=Haliea sp. TaxID=1932666 RepID=UPI000C53CB8B|nr:Calx-beta domain-containing protein [Haliea sp.]MAD65709.1 hypothetical protein [Haliea sp.]|tara:strand:+ start:47043 stop:48989 length:1947 start_codon:yes stop_codon:yes gene_type:complete
MFRKTLLASALLLPLSVSAQDVFAPAPEEQPVTMAAASSDTVTIDLVVFYQPIYKRRLGGFEALYERVNSLLSDINSIYKTSKTGVRFEVVELREATGIPDDQPYDNVYDEDGNKIKESATAIFSGRLLNPEGYYDENGNYQENYPEYLTYTMFGGDIGVYLTDYRDPDREVKLGAASQGGEYATIADEIILSPSSEVVPLTLAHELGHNLEAHHEDGGGRASARFDFAKALECEGKKTVMWSQGTRNASDSHSFFTSSEENEDGIICGESGVADNTQAILQTKVSASERRDRPASLGSVSFKQSSYTAGENEGVAQITLSRTGDLSESSSVLLIADSDTASTVSDLKEAHKRVTFEAGESEVTAELGVVADAKNEGAENVSLSLVYPYKATVSGGTASLTIEDNYSGSPGDFQLSEDLSVVEGEAATIVVSRVNGSDGEYVVNLSSDYADTNSATSNDFEKVSQRLIFEDGETEKSLAINTYDDEEFTGERIFKVVIENEEQILDETQVTITDNETPEVEYSLSSTEANAGSTARVTITRSGDTQGSTTVTATSVNGSLVAGSDFEELNESVTFETGETTKQVSINLTSDKAGTFSVELNSGESVTVSVEASDSNSGGDAETSGGSTGAFFLMLLLIGLLPRLIRKS